MSFSRPGHPVYNGSVGRPKTRSTKSPKRGPKPEKASGALSKPAPIVPSKAFAKAVLRAKPYALNPERLEQLLRLAAKKTAVLPRKPFRESWAYLHAMLRLLRAYARGEYSNVSASALLSIVAAVAYLVDPADFIPDEIPLIGFLDDATILEFAMQKTRATLDDFMAWELARLFVR